MKTFKDFLNESKKKPKTPMTKEEVLEEIRSYMGSSIKSSGGTDWQSWMHNGNFFIDWDMTFKRNSEKGFYSSNYRSVSSNEDTIQKIENKLKELGVKYKRRVFNSNNLDSEYSEYEQSIGAGIQSI